MDLIPYERFGKLRLSQFFPDRKVVNDPKDRGKGKRFVQNDITELEDWEFMDRVWVGEAIGFTEWLRLQDDPKVLRSISLHLAELPKSVAEAVFQTIGL